MSAKPLHTVICDLTEEEYDRQTVLANQDAARSAPRLMRYTNSGHVVAEHHMGRIAADAWAMATGLETSDQAQEAMEETAAAWPLTRKKAYLDAAGAEWTPSIGEESCYWHSTARQATLFLEEYPELLRILRADDPGTPAARMAAAASRLADEMDAHPYDSADWQDRWAQIRSTLSKIAAGDGAEDE